LNGGGRGSLPPDHPLYCSLARKVALGGADLILLVGTKLDFRLNYGEPPLIPREAKIVWLDTLPTDIGVNRGADVGVAGDVAGSLRALAAGLGKSAKVDAWHGAWVTRVREAEEAAREKENALMASD